MPRGTPGAKASKPHARTKLEKRVLSLDEVWAAGIEQRILGDAHPAQRDAILDPARRLTLLVGRGGGKTTTYRARALIKMTRKRNARIIYIATTRPAAEEINWAPLKEMIDALGLTSEFDFNESKMRCTCKRTGSTYRLVGADDKREIEKLRGQPFDEVQIDEGASHDPRILEFLIYRIIAPRLGERDGCIAIAGTPGHILAGPFYETTRSNSDLHRPYRDRELAEFKDWKKWSSHKWTLRDVVGHEIDEQLSDEEIEGICEIAADARKEGRYRESVKVLEQLLKPGRRLRYPALARLWREALIEKLANDWSDDNPIWKREYLGEWASDDTDNMYKYRPHASDGSPWNQWNPERIGVRSETVTGFAKLPSGPKDWLFGYGLDLGSKDPFALNVFALSPSDPTRKIRHVFGFERRKMYARLIAELLIGPEAVKQVLRGDGLPDKLGGLFGLTGWPAAIVADLAGLGETIIDELANVYGIQIKAAEKAGKFGAIELFNGDLVDGHMQILKDSPLEKQLGSLQWKVDEYGRLTENKADANHSTDSAIYIRRELGALFSGVETSQPQEPVGFVDPQGLGDEEEISGPSSDEYSSLLGNDDYGDLFLNG